MHRADMFTAEGMVLESVSMGEMRARCKPKLGIVMVSAVGAKLGEAVRSIRRGM
jgi:hypothetical protein